MRKNEKITLVKEAIHNPNEPRHYMTISKSNKTWYAKLGSRRLAESNRVLELREVGYSIYSSVIYFPSDCVDSNVLKKNKKNTHCPLKGTTCYFDLISSEVKVIDVAWTYENTISKAAIIKNMVAFDAKKIMIGIADHPADT